MQTELGSHTAHSATRESSDGHTCILSETLCRGRLGFCSGKGQEGEVRLQRHIRFAAIATAQSHLTTHIMQTITAARKQTSGLQADTCQVRACLYMVPEAGLRCLRRIAQADREPQPLDGVQVIHVAAVRQPAGGQGHHGEPDREQVPRRGESTVPHRPWPMPTYAPGVFPAHYQTAEQVRDNMERRRLRQEANQQAFQQKEERRAAELVKMELATARAATNAEQQAALLAVKEKSEW